MGEIVVTSPYWPRPNEFLGSLRGGRPPLVMWMALESPNIIEMAGAYGLDAAIIDMEHSSAGFEQVHAMIVAAQGAGMSALVRPPSIDSHDIGRVLDAGADGIVFAQISSRSDAEAAARSLRFPPDGTRGWSSHARHVRWTNRTVPLDGDPALVRSEFVRAANANIACVFTIEDSAGVDNVDEILDVGRPDAVFFGVLDFGAGVGFDAEMMVAANARVYSSCRARGIGFALSAAPRDPMEYYPGCFYSAGVDASVTSSAIGALLRDAHSAITEVHST